MKRAAITVWNNRVSPVFETSRQIFIVDCCKNTIKNKTYYSITDNVEVTRVCILLEQGVNILICGAISRIYFNMLISYGIQIYSFISGGVDEVLNAFLDNKLHLVSYKMPGCGYRHRKRFRGKRFC